MSASRWATAGSLVLAAMCWFPAVEAGAQQRLEHLLLAAEHLEQAGLADRAAEIRTLANEEMRAHGATLLQQRLRQLESLQKEIDLLRQAIATARYVKVRLQICELQTKKLEASGLGLVSLQQLLSNPTPTSLVDDNGKLTEFIELLQRQGIVSRLSAPTLMVADGQTATVSVGEQLAQAKNRPDSADPTDGVGGLRFDCRPEIRAGERLRLDVGLRKTSRSVADSTCASGGSGPDRGTCCELQTRLELQSGQTVLVGGSRTKSDGAESGLLLLLTAEIVASGKEFLTAP
jgi:Flp pilus assembly secretin CpaC